MYYLVVVMNQICLYPYNKDLSSIYLCESDLEDQCWAFIVNDTLFTEDTAFALFREARAKGITPVMDLMVISYLHNIKVGNSLVTYQISKTKLRKFLQHIVIN